MSARDVDGLVARLQAAFQRIRYEGDGPYIPDGDLFDEAAEVLLALKAENDGLREALKFYANPSIYEPHPHGIAFDRRDLSYHARAILGSVK